MQPVDPVFVTPGDAPQPDTSATLERLISPHTIAEFISGYWEQNYLHVSRDRNAFLGRHFADLISIDDLDHFLATICAAGPQRRDTIRLSKNGSPILASEFQSNDRGGLVSFDVDRVLKLYQDGASLIVTSVHQTFVPVATLCNDLARFFGVRVVANVYITPPHGQAFPAHRDNHDVFFLQVLGEKNWNLYGVSVSLGPWANIQLCLRAGELLYIPRGLVHEGKASAATSFHVTVGVHPYTWAQLLIDAVSELQQEDVEFQRSVAPRLTSLGDGGALETTVGPLLERLRDGKRLSRVATQRAADVRGPNRVPAHGRFRRLVEQADIAQRDKPAPPAG